MCRAACCLRSAIGASAIGASAIGASAIGASAIGASGQICTPGMLVRSRSRLALVAPEPLRVTLESLVVDGAVKHLPARSMWQLTPVGREVHASLIAEFVGDRGPALRAPYELFLEHNHRLKDLCTAWQTHDGGPNDHSDATYDGERIADIGAFHGDIAEVLVRFAAAIDRFSAYQPRLTGALRRLQAGDPKAFTGVMCDSYHDIWMELHEDLIQLLSIDRTAEGSF